MSIYHTVVGGRGGGFSPAPPPPAAEPFIKGIAPSDNWQQEIRSLTGGDEVSQGARWREGAEVQPTLDVLRLFYGERHSTGYPVAHNIIRSFGTLTIEPDAGRPYAVQLPTALGRTDIPNFEGRNLRASVSRMTGFVVGFQNDDAWVATDGSGLSQIVFFRRMPIMMGWHAGAGVTGVPRQNFSNIFYIPIGIESGLQLVRSYNGYNPTGPFMSPQNPAGQGSTYNYQWLCEPVQGVTIQQKVAFQWLEEIIYGDSIFDPDQANIIDAPRIDLGTLGTQKKRAPSGRLTNERDASRGKGRGK